MWQHFHELETKPSKGFKNIKWRSHFMFWYYVLIHLATDINHPNEVAIWMAGIIQEVLKNLKFPIAYLWEHLNR